MRRVAVLACAVLGWAAAPATAQVEAPAPYQLVRALQYGQDALARGGGPSGDQGKLLGSIAAAFTAAPAEAWRDPKNVAAAGVFLFSGGAAAPIRKLMAANAFSETDLPLLRGAAAYADGREGEARALLLPIPPETVRPTLQGHLALIQATLIGRNDPAKAVETLARARLLAPGTLVEETALRREILWAAEARDAKLMALAGRYLRRFSTSAYAAAFRPKLVEWSIEAALTSGSERPEGLDAVLDALPPPDRRGVVLDLARTALTRGRLALARWAAETALGLAEAGGPEAARADLYWAAAAIVSPDHPAALAKAEGLSSAPLDPAHRDLLQAVLTLARTVRAWPQPEATVAPPGGPELPPTARVTLDRATAALASAEQALRGSR